MLLVATNQVSFEPPQAWQWKKWTNGRQEKACKKVSLGLSARSAFLSSAAAHERKKVQPCEKGGEWVGLGGKRKWLRCIPPSHSHLSSCRGTRKRRKRGRKKNCCVWRNPQSHARKTQTRKEERKRKSRKKTFKVWGPHPAWAGKDKKKNCKVNSQRYIERSSSAWIA